MTHKLDGWGKVLTGTHAGEAYADCTCGRRFLHASAYMAVARQRLHAEDVTLNTTECLNHEAEAQTLTEYDVYTR